MVQVIFFALLIVALFGGFLAYYAPSQKDINPMKFMMDNTGYTSMDTTNRKKSEQINMVTHKGLMEIRRQMQDLALEQNKFLDTIQDQQNILKNTSDILSQSQQKDGTGKDILQLQALASEIQDQQRLLLDHGQELIALNNRLTQNRQLVAEQVDLANINTESSLDALKQRYASLNNQASDFFDKVSQHNQEVRDQMVTLQSKLHDMAGNSASNGPAQQQIRIQSMLEREDADMKKLADCEERGRNFLQDSREKMADLKQQSDDARQRAKDLIDEERQKEEDQQQRMQDQQNR